MFDYRQHISWSVWSFKCELKILRNIRTREMKLTRVLQLHAVQYAIWNIHVARNYSDVITVVYY